MILDESQQGTIPASGVVQVVIPVPRTERWHITNMAVITNQASTVTTMPIATVYRNSVHDGAVLGSTYTGARDSGGFDIDLEGGDQLIGRWTGGVVGSIATLSVYGTRESV